MRAKPANIAVMKSNLVMSANRKASPGHMWATMVSMREKWANNKATRVSTKGSRANKRARSVSKMANLVSNSKKLANKHLLANKYSNHRCLQTKDLTGNSMRANKRVKMANNRLLRVSNPLIVD